MDRSRGSPDPSHNAYVEIGIVKYPGYLESAVFGFTELFTVANRFASSHEDRLHPVIRVTHWQASLGKPRQVDLVFDSHPGIGRGVPWILIAPPSIAKPISSEAATPYAIWLARLHARGSIVASVCGGAFLPAEAKRLLGPTVMRETARFMLMDLSDREQSYYSSFLPRLDHGDAEILKVQHWLQRNGCRNVDLTKMAKTAGLEVRTFLRRIKKATTLKPTEYCQRLRIGKSREMLESTRQSIEKISWAVGYEDPASFRRIFHRIMGLSPSDYRNRFTVASASKKGAPLR
jgi:transcriptional regulator GlxA family with amidase domain